MDKMEFEEIVKKMVRQEINIERNGSRVIGNESFMKRWGEDIAEHGFVQVPKILLSVNEINTNEKIMISILLGYGDMVFPGDVVLSKTMGISRRQVQNILCNLEKKGWIERKNKGGRRYINLYPNIKKKLIEHATLIEKCRVVGPHKYISRLRRETWKLINNADKRRIGGWKRAALECMKEKGEDTECLIEVPPVMPRCLLCPKYKKRLIAFRYVDLNDRYIQESM